MCVFMKTLDYGAGGSLKYILNWNNFIKNKNIYSKFFNTICWNHHQTTINPGICNFLPSSQFYKTFTRSFSSFRISSEVLYSIEKNLPVIALESAIISHGMPYPHNIETAFKVQDIIKEEGAIPATVGVINGELIVGLTNEEIEFLGKPPKSQAKNSTIKVSRRDIPIVLSQKLNGGTTVSGTIVAATLAKIPIFVTGGLGGVHRGAEHTFDISADLKELGRNPITVISAGIKSILDIGKTLEYLETEGVCVCVLRRDNTNKNNENKKFPCFFTSESQYLAPYSLNDESQAAQLIHSTLQFGLESGILIAVPIPKDDDGYDEIIENAIIKSLENAKQLGIQGKDMTPFLLGQVNKITGGDSLKANQLLIQNNAKVGAKIAVELSKLKRGGKNNDITATAEDFLLSKSIHKTTNVSSCISSYSTTSNNDQGEELFHENHNQSIINDKNTIQLNFDFKFKKNCRPVIIGGSSLDLIYKVKEDHLVNDGRTHESELNIVCGGVGRNMSEALKLLGHDPLLISAIGDDLFGKEILNNFENSHMDITGINILTTTPTSTYSAILNHSGECMFGLGQMKIHDNILPSYIEKFKNDIKSASIVIIDGNIPINSMTFAMKICNENDVPVWFEPTELRKVKKLLQVNHEVLPCITFISPNINELLVLTNSKLINQNDIHLVFRQCFKQFIGLQLILLTKGKLGFTVIYRTLEKNPTTIDYECIDFPAPILNSPEEKLISVSGAGDCLNAGFISGLLNEKDINDCTIKAIECTKKSLLSHYNVPHSIKC